MDLIRTLIARSAPDSLILDLGANEGGYTHTFLQYQGDIHAFEPCPKLAVAMRERFKNEPRVTVFQKGVSDHAFKETGLTVFQAWTLGKAGQPNKRGLSPGALAVVGEEPFDVEFITVDDHVQGKRIVDFIKLDVDGYEFRVLRGASETIKLFRPNILLELSYLVDDIGDSVPDFLDYIYSTLGYQLFDEKGRRLEHQWLLNNYPWHTSYDVAMIPDERGWVPL